MLNNLMNDPLLTQRLLAEQFVKQTGRYIDHSTYGRRLSRTDPALFRAVFRHLYDKLAAHATQGEIMSLRLRLVDATVVTLAAKLLHWGRRSGSRRASGTRRQVKSVFELSGYGLPNLLHICKEQAELADNAAIGRTLKPETQPNDLWGFDRGWPSREPLFEIHTGGRVFDT